MDIQNHISMLNKIQFESIDDTASIIKVIGVGGGGSNAVSYMFNQGINGVDFIICNTDKQALHTSPVQYKVQLGKDLTSGWGAGAKPEVGKKAAVESEEDIKTLLSDNTKMLFITAGMGGGTGTGAAPVIAGIAKEMGILTVAIVTLPFSWEGRKKMEQALNGIKELKKNTDSLLLICNDKLREYYGNLTMTNAFSKADDVLKIAAKGISDIVNRIGKVNVDFEDVNTVMRNSGVAIMGSGMAEGENRATEAIDMALSSPLLNDNNIKGASNILLYLTSGTAEITMDEFESITQHIQREAGLTAEIIWGICQDETLENKIAVTIVATGFDYNELNNTFDVKAKASTNRVNRHMLEEDKPVQNDSQIQVIGESDEEKIVRNRMLRKEEKIVVEKKKEFVKDIFNFDLVSRQMDEIVEPQSQQKSEPEDISKDIVFKNEEVNENPVEEMTLKSNFEIINELENSIKINQLEVDENDVNNQDIEMIVTVNKNANNERNRKLRELSEKIGDKNKLVDIEHLEKVPAYQRRNVVLSNVPAAAESRVSKYTLSEDADNNVEVKSNNSFLHDNVD
jgi:cell division protein FtsZ